MNDAALQKLVIDPYELESGTLITSKSYLMDRIVPACGILDLPAKTVAGGELQWGIGAIRPNRLEPDPRYMHRKLRKFLPARSRVSRDISGSVVFDCRVHSPQNWAHFLNYHLPFVFKACETFDLAWDQVVLLLPANTPRYITAAADLFGIKTDVTDDLVTAQGLVFDMPQWTVLRPVRWEWVKSARVTQALTSIEAQAPPVPEQVFLSRRTTRALSNEKQISEWLGSKGFETIYPEDLNPAAQIALFRRARAVVAVHGAGIAPLLYHGDRETPLELLEILPCGHMTDVYRVMSQQVGAKWLGIQGRLKPEYVQPAYQFSNRFTRYSLDSFELDLDTLALGFVRLGWNKL